MAERNCPRCTLFNPADATNCAACDMKLPPAPPPAAPLSPAGGEDFSDFDAVPVAALDVNAIAAPPPAVPPAVPLAVPPPADDGWASFESAPTGASDGGFGAFDAPETAARDVGSTGAHGSRSRRRRRNVGFRRISGGRDIRYRRRRLKVGFQRNAVVTA